MAGPNKKARNPAKPESENDSSSEEESEEGTYYGQKEIQATFEGRNPECEDFHGIKQLLNQLFLKAHIDVSQMCDMIIEQNGIGSVLKQSFSDSDDEDDMDVVDESNVFAITTILNLTANKETPCVQQLYNVLEDVLSKNATPDIQETMKSILSNPLNKIGFLINERFVNMSSSISATMLPLLCEEIERIKKKNPSYNFDYFVIICKTYKYKGDPQEIYTNCEEEIFCKESDANFEFCVENESDSGLSGQWLSEDKQVSPYRKIVIFKADKFKNILNEISTFIK